MSERWLPGAPAAAWAARNHVGYALDVLRHTACAGCSLGSVGLRDHVRPGLHLCRRRLDGLSRIVAPPVPDPTLGGTDLLDADQLRTLGRLTSPLLRRAGGRFEVLPWEDATHLLRARLEEHRGRWTLDVGAEELSNEAAWMLGQVSDRFEPGAVRRVGAMTAWRDALEAATGLRACPSSLADLRSAERIVLWGPVTETHPELARWIPRKAAVLTIGCSVPGHRELYGEPADLVRRGIAAAWRGRPDTLEVGDPPSFVPEPALADPALHVVDASLEPGPHIALALLQGALGVAGRGMVVLGGQPGLEDLGPREVDGPASDVAVVLGDAPFRGRPRFRAHLAWFATPTMLDEPVGEVLVLPLRMRPEVEGGTTTTSADRVVRFSPQVLGRDPGDARAPSSVLGDVLGRADLVRGPSAIRARIAADLPAWRGLDEPFDTLQWGGAQPLADGFLTDDGRARLPDY